MSTETSSSTPSAQAARTKFVVGGMALMFVMSWTMSLGRLFGTKFWDQKYNLEQIYDHDGGGDPSMDNSTALEESGGRSYFSNRRYVYFLPHVLGAVFWWNLYFLQLVPQIRHRFKTFHRYLGRCLMTVVIIQTSSGVGLALTSNSSIVKIVSIVLAIAAYYCIFHAFRYAYNRDIPMHKYWVYRLVGYMQTIALQRFWILVLIVSHQMGFHGLYPSLDGASQDVANKLMSSMFDDSFVLGILTSVYVTEWYLAGMKDMMKAPVTSAAYRNEGDKAPSADASQHNVDPEKRPLL
jgi:hypothetical protein